MNTGGSKIELLLRVYILLALFIIFSVVIYAKVVQISIVEGEEWRARGDSLYLRYKPIEAERGNILASGGEMLATSLQFFNIYMDPNSSAMSTESFNKHIDSLAWNLSEYVLHKSPTAIKNELIKARSAGSRYHLIKKGVDFRSLEKIRSFPLFREGQYKGGLIVEKYSKRIKPYRSLSSRTIGLDRESGESVGLENSYDSDLKGKKGQRLMQRVPGNAWIPVHDLTEIKPERGSDLKTTIDINIQDVTHHSLTRALKKHDADWGCAIVMDVKTGGIVAISNLTKGTNGYHETINYAVRRAIEPGSVMKLPTIMAMMENENVKLEDKISLNRGIDAFCGTPLKDSERHSINDTTVLEAFARSSNVGIARLSYDVYRRGSKEEKFIRGFKGLQLHKPTGIDLIGEAAPEIKDAHSQKEFWSCLSVPWMAIGYELKLTPLQILTFYNAVANDGKKMKPYLVHSILNHQGTEIIRLPQVMKKRLASTSTIKNAKKMLEAVVEHGTASHYNTDRYSFAGKTGTAQINYYKNEERPGHQGSFAGYFPADNPRYSCFVVLYNPRKKGYYGGTVALPVFREIADHCYILGRFKSHDKEKIVRTADYYRVIHKDDLARLSSHNGLKYEDQSQENYGVLMPSDSIPVLANRNIKENDHPSVKGMSLKDALFILENKGYEVRYKGLGKVISESYSNAEIELVLN